MIEALIATLLFATILSSRKGVGTGNPFQIYFGTWLIIFVTYKISQDNYVSISPEFGFLLLLINAFAITIFLVLLALSRRHFSSPSQVPNLTINTRLLATTQMATLICLPIAFREATSLASGDDIFSMQGYVKLRASMTHEGHGFGLIAYISIIAHVIASLRFFMPRKNWRDWLYLIAALIASSFFIYISTGRTFALLVICLCAVPLIISGQSQLRGFIVGLGLTVILFSVITTMTNKGLAVDESFASNIESIRDSIKPYTVAPLLAMSTVFDGNIPHQYGENTFRFFISFLHASNLTTHPPVELIKEYVYVPLATNVYTVYEPYYRDFSVAGMFIPPFLLVLHWWLYKNARRIGGQWIFYYSASVYPLVMQFFQDQYFSAISMWIQISFWYWLFIASPTRQASTNSGTAKCLEK